MNWIKLTPEMKLPKGEVLARAKEDKNYYLVGMLKWQATYGDMKINEHAICIADDKHTTSLINVTHYCLIEPPND